MINVRRTLGAVSSLALLAAGLAATAAPAQAAPPDVKQSLIGSAENPGVASSGLLGYVPKNRTFDPRYIPVDENSPAADEGFVQVAATGNAACGLTDMGNVFCWGSGASLGQGTNDEWASASLPVKVDIGEQVTKIKSTYVQVSPGGFCAFTVSNKTLCWGRSMAPDSYAAVISSPEELLPAKEFKDLAAMTGTACAIETSGRVGCWGNNRYGQMGNGSAGTATATYPYAEPNLPPATEFASITANTLSVCALSTLGDAYCWGFNAGAFGIGSNTQQTTPVEVPQPNGKKWSTFKLAGSALSLGVNTDKELYRSGRGDASMTRVDGGDLTGKSIADVFPSNQLVDLTSVAVTEDGVVARVVGTTGTALPMPDSVVPTSVVGVNGYTVYAFPAQIAPAYTIPAPPAPVAGASAEELDQSAVLTFEGVPTGAPEVETVEVLDAEGNTLCKKRYDQLDDPTCPVTGLPNGVDTELFVVTTGLGGVSAPVPVTVRPFSVPDSPRDIVADAGDGSLTVSWGAPFDNGRPISGYLVRTVDGKVMCRTSTTTTCVLRPLANLRPAVIEIVAFNEAGASIPSEAVVGVPRPATSTGGVQVPLQATVVTGWTKKKSVAKRRKKFVAKVQVAPAGSRYIVVERFAKKESRWVYVKQLSTSDDGRARITLKRKKRFNKYRLVVAESATHQEFVSVTKKIRGK